MKKGLIMWQCWILMLCATGISCGLVGPQSFSINPPPHNRLRNDEGKIRRFACPVGFFRLKRNCYYLSAGTAPWKAAQFHCKDRNSTLAVLDKNGKDKILRKYLMGDQFTKLERWIGGIYNWQEMSWEWGVSGEKIKFQNFERLTPGNPEQYAWHCIVMDPNVEYKWEPRSCVVKKHYICEVPAGRIGQRRRKRIDSGLAPQNQRLKPKGKVRKGKRREGKGGRKGEAISMRRNKVQQGRRGWAQQDKDQTWVHGEKPGFRAPGKMQLINGTRTRIPNRTRHQPRTNPKRLDKKIPEIIPREPEYTAFLGDSPARTHPQSLSEDTVVLNQFTGGMNDFAHEEVLLKT